jgi:hypothetical protein
MEIRIHNVDQNQPSVIAFPESLGTVAKKGDVDPLVVESG